MALKYLSKLAAGTITAFAAGLVLALDNNWFALVALSSVFLLVVGVGLVVVLRQNARFRPERAARSSGVPDVSEAG